METVRMALVEYGDKGGWVHMNAEDVADTAGAAGGPRYVTMVDCLQDEGRCLCDDRGGYHQVEETDWDSDDPSRPDTVYGEGEPIEETDWDGVDV